MRKLIPLTYLSAFVLFTSCATYRNGQTPDDVYLAAAPDMVSYVDFSNKKEYNNNYRGSNQVRIQFGNHSYYNQYPLYFFPGQIIPI